MTRVVPVTIVRPYKTGAQLVGKVVGTVLGTFLVAWLLMLIAGAITPWHVGYWRALLALIGIRMLQNSSGWLQWTQDKRELR